MSESFMLVSAGTNHHEDPITNISMGEQELGAGHQTPQDILKY